MIKKIFKIKEHIVMNLNWSTIGIFLSSKHIKYIGMTRNILGLKTSVSARAPWVRIPPPPLSTTDFNKIAP